MFKKFLCEIGIHDYDIWRYNDGAYRNCKRCNTYQYGDEWFVKRLVISIGCVCLIVATFFIYFR